MEANTSITTDTLLSTQCFNCKKCNKVLFAPIILVENVGNLCNSCFDTEKSKYSASKYTENTSILPILKLLYIPCQNTLKGCDKRIKYDEIQHHEANCEFNTVHCPIVTTKCKWNSRRLDLVNHLTEKHTDDTLDAYETTKICIRINLNTELVKIITFSSAKFIIRFKTDVTESKMWYKIYDLENQASNYTFHLIHYASGDNQLKVQCNVTRQIEDEEFDKQNASQLDLTVLKQILHVSDRLKTKIEIDHKTTKRLTNKFLEEQISCPICEYTMKPPIYVCKSGHSICENCRLKLNECPQCRAEFETTRNYLVESLTDFLQYPCEYRILGCKVLGFPDEIRAHEKTCYYRSFDCMYPLCTYEGYLTSLVTHFHTSHSIYTHYSVKLEVPVTYTDDANSKRRYFMLAYGQVFRVTFKRDDENTFWAVEYLTGENQKDYFYKVKAMDKSKIKKISKTVETLKPQIVDEVLFRQCVCYSNETIESLGSGNRVISFVIKIISRINSIK